MFNKIDEVQRQYAYAVQPVKLFETQNSNLAQKSSFDFLNRMQKSGNNPSIQTFLIHIKETNSILWVNYAVQILVGVQ